MTQNVDKQRVKDEINDILCVIQGEISDVERADRS